MKEINEGVGSLWLWCLGVLYANTVGNGTPLQYSCLENPMDGGAWWAAVHGVARSRTLLSDFTLFFHFHALEKETAPHSSVLAWRIPGTGEPVGLYGVAQSQTRLKWLSSSSSTVVLVLKRCIQAIPGCFCSGLSPFIFYSVFESCIGIQQGKSDSNFNVFETTTFIYLLKKYDLYTMLL